MLESLKRKRSEEGFTLIELLIVIIILAILAVIVVFAVGTTTTNASIAACKSTVKSVETAVEAFKAQTGTYPKAVVTLTGKKTVTGQTVGPWLRSAPTANKSGHYTVSLVATTGKVNVSIKGGAGTTADGTPNPCTAA
jgi:prepilin-type N-terminal cleavage/methylation domain-containing protein